MKDAANPHQHLDDRLARVEGVVAFYPTFRDVDWSALLQDAHQVDIAVYYWDSWVKQNADALEAFFANSDSIRIVMTDPEVEPAIEVVARRLPEYTLEMVRQKVVNTLGRLEQARAASGSTTARIEGYFFEDPLSYSAVRLDSSRVVLSVYEQFRQQKIDSPAIVLDLMTSDHLRRYWDKEFGGYFKASRRAPGY